MKGDADQCQTSRKRSFANTKIRSFCKIKKGHLQPIFLRHPYISGGKRRTHCFLYPMYFWTCVYHVYMIQVYHLGCVVSLFDTYDSCGKLVHRLGSSLSPAPTWSPGSSNHHPGQIKMSEGRGKETNHGHELPCLDGKSHLCQTYENDEYCKEIRIV